jgi:hypothetical protein
MPDIRIDDLAHPRLTDRQSAAIAGAPPVTLTTEAVLDAARAATGLSDFGAADFRARLALWLQSFEEDRDLTALGRATLFGECVRYASSRLRIEDLLRRHPEIERIAIDRPIMVAGLPRSGTTHLVNILAADPRLRSTPLWETMEPIPGLADHGTPDPRQLRTAALWGAFEEMLPLMPAMHEMAPDHVHEDIELQGPDFSSYLPEWLSRPARWRDHYLSHDQTPHYAYAKKVMQALSWMRGPARWAVKSPPHMENLPALIAVHPQAIVPITHRDPVAVLQSAITMIAYGDRVRRERQDLPALAAWWIDRIETLLRRCVRDREAVPPGQSIDILFHDYMADQKAIVQKVYALADLEMTREAEARIDAFLAAHPRNRHGRVVYDLEGDFGVDVGRVRERFAFYYGRFPVRKEAVPGERL